MPARAGTEVTGQLNILVLYSSAGTYPLRPTIEDHTYAFQRNSAHRCAHFNVAVQPVPRWAARVPWDIIVFHTIFLSARWSREYFAKMVARIAPLRDSPAVKIALPQDEFINTDVLGRFINDFGITHVFSVAPPSEWSTIYPEVDRARVQFHQVLTGYLDPQSLRRIQALARATPERTLDIGYRAWHAAPWLGRHGLIKARLAEEFVRAAARRPLQVDVSTRAKDTLLGDDWFRFLLRCRYTIGVEGGASIIDRDGSVRARTEAYVQAHPEATFDEIERECFPGLDGNLALFAISPRHLEACATRTCQILVEGTYNGALEAGRHYIPLKPDLSNVDDVLDRLADEARRQAIVETAYRDVVASGRYTTRGFVDFVLDRVGPALRRQARPDSAWTRLRIGILQLVDRASWLLVAALVYAARLRQALRQALRRPWRRRRGSP